MSQQNSKTNSTSAARTAAIAVLVGIAFFAAFKFASAQSATSATAVSPQQVVGGTPAAAPAVVPGQDDPVAAGGCACCGDTAPTEGGVTGEPVEGAAQVADGVQRISVDVSSVYSPNVIKLQSGVPAEVTFGQGAGCTAQVMSRDLEFFEDLTQGPRTVRIAALEPGEYGFSCGMEMVFGKFVVE